MEKYSEFTKEFAHILDTLENMNSKVIITGDFNIDLLNIADKVVLGEYIDMLTSHSFFPKITLIFFYESSHTYP